MPKLRVYQLARELNLDNSEIIRELQHMGVPVTSHSNTVEDRLADQLRRRLGSLAAAAKTEVAPPPEEPVVETVETQPEPVEAPPVVVAPKIEAKVEPPPPPEPKPVPKPEEKPITPPPVATAPRPTPP